MCVAPLVQSGSFPATLCELQSFIANQLECVDVTLELLLMNTIMQDS